MDGIEGWYDEATRVAYEDRSFQKLHAGAGERGGLLAISRPEADEPIGLVEYQRGDRWLVISFIALAKAQRGWGYGSEAVRLLEEWAVREGIAERFRAAVDARNGLGLYFWLRLGYRPAGSGEFGWPAGNRRDMMPMVRTDTDD